MSFFAELKPWSSLLAPCIAALYILGMLVSPALGQEDKAPAGKDEAGLRFFAWNSIPVDQGRLPWAIYDPETMTLDGKNLTPGFEAMATRFGKVALRFTEKDDKVLLELNKKPVRYQPNEMVELGGKGHFAYVRAADDRFMFRVGLLTEWLRKNKEKAEAALGKEALAEFETLYNRHDQQAKLGKGRKNDLTEMELDFFLFQYLEGRPALAPIPGTKITLASFWERELWANQIGKARFNHNHKKDREFIEFHCEKFTGADGSPFRGKHRNTPPTQLGDPEPFGRQPAPR